MKFRAGPMICIVLLLILGGCAYRHYLGLHGSSIRMYPDVHAGVREDRQCLECHHPEKNPTGPPTSHPEFTGCLKCHNDPAR
jgi:hypothetical protein